ncbi:MAG: exo-alpha-sialidase [Burkholderiaceae bacterium]
MQTILVGTRKGLFVIQASNGSTHAASRIAAHHFLGEPVSQLLVDPHDGAWIVALNLGHFGIKLHKSTDHGKSWQALGAPAFPLKPGTGPLADDPTPWNVEMVWSLAAGGNDEPGTLWAGCLPAGLFKSTDGGQTWVLNEPLWQEPGRLKWMGGGYDHAGIHTVLVDPRDARHLTLGISCGGVWQTHDGGATWKVTAEGMINDYTPPELAQDPNTQDPHSLVHCAANPDVLWLQHHCGLYKSTDGGLLWQPIPAPKPSGFGFAVACDPANPQRAWFVPAIKDQFRVPVDGKLVVTRTDDGGKKFKLYGEGLPSGHAYDLIYRHALDVAADGQSLAMASTTGNMWLSHDAGESWQTVSGNLPPVAVVRFAG